MDDNQKIFLAFAIGAPIVYFVYRNMSTTAATTAAAPAAAVSFTGHYANADGCKNCKEQTNFTGQKFYFDGMSQCQKLMSALVTTHEQLNNKNLHPAQITSLKNQEMKILSQLQQNKCKSVA